MTKNYLIFTWLFLFVAGMATAQPWVQDNSIFNPSGVPSLPFSQPRFGDLDGDGDQDLIIGSINDYPVYIENTGTAEAPAFVPGDDIFSMVSSLDAEMGVCYDIDADGDLDFITGGYTGLNLYTNTGTAGNPVFEKTEGFFSGLSVGQNPIPALADIDDDGDADMVVGFSESGLVKLYTNTGTATAATFSEAEMYEIGDVGLYAYPQFADMDADGDQDLLVGRDAQGFIFYRNTGDATNAVWEADTEPFDGLAADTYWNSPGLADLDADGTIDLVYGTASGPLHYIVNTGTPEVPAWEENTDLFGGVLDAGGASNPFFYDYDNDGDLDMFSGSWLGDVLYFENIGTPSGPAWIEDSEPFADLAHSIYSAVTVGDVDADGLPDIIVGDLSGSLYLHRNTGDGFVLENDLQNVSLGGWSAPRLVDFDDDGDLDILCGNEDGVLTYLENQGTPQAADWVEVPGFFDGISVSSSLVPAVSDLDFDGDLDILCGDMWGELTYYEQNGGSWIENTEMFQGITVDQNATPAFADLDNDGDPDLTIGEYDGPFNYYRNQLMVAGIHEASPSRIRATVFPNPLCNDSHLQITLDAQTDIQLQIMNSAGQQVMSRNWQKLPAGVHNLPLTAGNLPPGMYFIRINLPAQPVVIKAVKM